MSLVVHKLVLSPGGAATNTQTPTHHVTLAAYTPSRSNVGDPMVRTLEGSSNSLSIPPSSSSPYSTSSSSSSSSSKHSSTYNLPFVLQDHNYGAPPPPTPPQSPPLPSSSGSSLYNVSSHHVSHPAHTYHNTQTHVRHNANHSHQTLHTPTQSHHQITHNLNLSVSQSHHQNPTILHQSQHTLSHPHNVQKQPPQHHHHPHHQSQPSIPQVSPSPRLGIISSSSASPAHVPSILTNHSLNTMPPHRQQFMPHPKPSIFPSPHIPPPPVEIHQSPCGISAPHSSTLGAETDDDSRLSDRSSSVGPSGEETETAPEGEGDEQPVDDSITRCVCDFSHDDGYMIQCDRCFVWQHVDCMEIDRDNIPDEYLCEACEPRPIDRFKARALQIRRRQEIKAHLARLSSSDSDDNTPISSKGRSPMSKVQDRKVVKKKKVKQIKDLKSRNKGQLSVMKKTSAPSCNNTIVPGTEDKERKPLLKTRRRKSNSTSGGEGVSDDSTGGPVERLRAWVEGYEVAVTNHYSPELRARVQAARINGVSPDLRASTHGAVLGHRCKVVDNPHPLMDVFDSKILVAATRLSVNTAIAEYQGKYLLASQWHAQQPPTGQQYMPYVLQYHMPKEGLDVCVDARTYGNDARFTRRSCRPNAEVRHVVERGSLHLYLVATREIEEAEEVMLALETANSMLDLVCCLPEKHECYAPQPVKTEYTSPVHTPPHKKNGLIVSTKKALKKQQLQLQLRTSKRTTSTENRPQEPPVTPQNNTPVTPVKQRRASGCGKSPVKSPSVSLSSSPEDSGKDSSYTPPTLVTTPETPKASDKQQQQQQQKMTREERKIAAYMKAFERMEKLAQRRQEMEKKKEEDKGKDHKDKEKKRSDGDEDWDKTSSADEGLRNTTGPERCKRKGKKGRGKGSPLKRNHRVESASDLTGDESSCASAGLTSPAGGSVESMTLSFNSPPQGSSNASGFRFPKTKKTLMNEWLNETVEPVLPVGSLSGIIEAPSGVPTCYMRSPTTPLRRSSSVNQGMIQGTVLNLDMPGGSAKKRWLRQAISEETETPHFNGLCPSPNSRPDSPNGGADYITPLKKRRLARESMSSEQSCTPPSTPVHSASMEDDKLSEEMEAELADVASACIKLEEDNCSEDHVSPHIMEDKHDFECVQGDIGDIKKEMDELHSQNLEERESSGHENDGINENLVLKESIREKRRKEVEEELKGNNLKVNNIKVEALNVLSSRKFSKDEEFEELEVQQLHGKRASRYSLDTRRERRPQSKKQETKKVPVKRVRSVTGKGKKRGSRKQAMKESIDDHFGEESEMVELDEIKSEDQALDETLEGCPIDLDNELELTKGNGKKRLELKAIMQNVANVAAQETTKLQVYQAKQMNKRICKKGPQRRKTNQQDEVVDDIKMTDNLMRLDPSPLELGKGKALNLSESEGLQELEQVSDDRSEEWENDHKEAIQSVTEEPKLGEEIKSTNENPQFVEDVKNEKEDTKLKEDVKNTEEPELMEDVKIKKEHLQLDEDVKMKKEEPKLVECVKIKKEEADFREEVKEELVQRDEPEPEAKNGELGGDGKVESVSKDVMKMEEASTKVKAEEDALKECVKDKQNNKEPLMKQELGIEDIENSKVKLESPSLSKIECEPENAKCENGKAEEVRLEEQESQEEAEEKKVDMEREKQSHCNIRTESGDIDQVEKVDEECLSSAKNNDSQLIQDVQIKREHDDDELETTEGNEKSAKEVEHQNLQNEEVNDGNEDSEGEEKESAFLRSKAEHTDREQDVESINDLQSDVKEVQNENCHETEQPPEVDAKVSKIKDSSEITNEHLDDEYNSKVSELEQEAPTEPQSSQEGSATVKQSCDDPSSSVKSPVIRSSSPVAKTSFPPEECKNEISNIGNELDQSGPRTPDCPPPASPSMRGPRTPDGPAPTTPEDPCISPASPRYPECSPGSPSAVQYREERGEREKTPDKLLRTRTRGPCTPPTSPPPPLQEDDSNLEIGRQSDKEQNEDLDGTMSSVSQTNLERSSKPAPVKRKLSILEYRKRKSVTSEDGKGAGLMLETSLTSTISSGPNSDPPSTLSILQGTSVPSSGLLREPSCSPMSSPSEFAQADSESPSLSLSPVPTIGLDSKIMKEEEKNDVTSEISANSGDTAPVTTKTPTASPSPIPSPCPSPSASPSCSPVHNPVNVPSQDVKWNAAPTLLERQRENLTARLRREFGLCISDDDDDKSGLRLGCVSVVGRPSPPLLPPPAPLVSSSSLPPRGRKPSGLQAGPDGEDRDRSHKRQKEKNLPPPPPPPTAPPKNSIFIGREVTVQKINCSAKVVVSSASLLPTSSSSSSSSTSTSRLPVPSLPAPPPVVMPATFQGPGILQPIPVPPPAIGKNSLASGIPPKPPGLPTSLVDRVPGSSAIPPPSCPITPPVVPMSIPPRISSIPHVQSVGGPSTTPRPQRPSSSVAGQVGGSRMSSPVTPQNNTVYRGRLYSGSQYSSSSNGGIPSSLPIYPSVRVAPPPAHNPAVRPPQGVGHRGPPPGLVRPPRLPPPAQGPPGLVAPSLGYNSGGYPGLDCSAPGSRGS